MSNTDGLYAVAFRQQMERDAGVSQQHEHERDMLYAVMYLMSFFEDDDDGDIIETTGHVVEKEPTSSSLPELPEHL